MIYKCANCDASLKFNPTIKLLECDNCCSVFRVEDVTPYEDYSEVEEQTSFETQYFDTLEETEMMDCNVYSCTSCGAELSINGVEASTFCAYCGQPTIVFNRVSKQVKPAYIIPFQFVREQAEGAIREKLSKGFFIPKEIRHFEVERLRGIYIPFWLVDMYYHDKQVLKGRVKSGKNHVTRYFYREGEVEFKNITADASRQLSDETSQRLEPYDISRKKPFDVGYMSGFYADRYDVPKEEATAVAAIRAGELYDQEIIKTVRASSVKVVNSDPDFKVHKKEYIMLPAWFMTFRYKDEPYTVLVNGQTGKIIGAVPFHKGKVVSLYLFFALLFTVIAFPFSQMAINILLHGKGDNSSGLLILLCAAGGVMFTTGVGLFKKTMKSIGLTKAKNTEAYVRDRQEDM